MPVEISIVCWDEGPGTQSKSIDTSICVSFVFRERVACLAAIIMWSCYGITGRNQTRSRSNRKFAKKRSRKLLDNNCKREISDFTLRVAGCRTCLYGLYFRFFEVNNTSPQ